MVVSSTLMGHFLALGAHNGGSWVGARGPGLLYFPELLKKIGEKIVMHLVKSLKLRLKVDETL